MDSGYFLLAGGLGLFLFGKQVMTGALHQLAGRRMRQLLARFTATPVTAAATGALVTAAVQSSAATTVTAVGFVGAGLLSFRQALGIILGANIGTTLTGWIVLLVGFKLEIGLAALPLLLIAALVQVLGRGLWSQIGLAVAGFSLVFVGVDMLKQGMEAFDTSLTAAMLPPDTWGGRLLLVGIGIAITAVTQSSTAGMAALLVLLGAGSMSFPQAAALMIGMDIGTTSGALLATAGGSSAMRQTGYAHLLYNVTTGILAFALLGATTPLIFDRLAGGNAQVAILIFHSGFNLLGVMLILPLLRQFEALVKWFVPDRGGSLAETLDPGLLGDHAAALDTASGVARRIANALFADMAGSLGPPAPGSADRVDVQALQFPLADLGAFIARISPLADQPMLSRRHRALLHEYDHLLRLRERCLQVAEIANMRLQRDLARYAAAFGAMLGRYADGGDPQVAEQELARFLDGVRGYNERFRDRAIRAASAEVLDFQSGFDQMDSMRWLRRSAIHAQRIVHHQSRADMQAPPPDQPEGADPDEELAA